MEQSDIATLAVIAVAAVVAPVLAELLRRFRIPGVVIEIGLGILIGPAVLGLAELDTVEIGLSELGLAFLMFLAGFEIDFAKIRGTPLTRAAAGWGVSAALALATAAFLVAEGFALDSLLIGLALTTTALGTLLPMLRDDGAIDTPFGGHVLAIGTAGEFLPIVAIALLFTSDAPLRTAVLLVVFIGIAAVSAVLATRAHAPRAVAVLQRHLHSSAQLPVRLSMLLVIVLVWVASELGLDVLLGAFAAGIVVRLLTEGEDQHAVASKLEAIGFGFLIPIFFITSGMRFDLDALTSDASTLLRLPIFLLLFLFVRGTPVFLLYRRDVPRRDLAPLALFSATALPLVVVITGIGTSTGRMLPANAAALVGAGMLSVLLFPLVGFALRRRPDGAPPTTDPVDESVDESAGPAAGDDDQSSRRVR